MSELFTIKPRRPLKADLPAHAPEGELIITSDTHEVYTGEGESSPLARVGWLNTTQQVCATSVLPASGPAAGGTAVILFGHDFYDGATVTFDGTPATDVVVLSASRISAVTPPSSAGLAVVVVKTPDWPGGTGWSYVYV
jgi:hypothetical protein